MVCVSVNRLISFLKRSRLIQAVSLHYLKAYSLNAAEVNDFSKVKSSGNFIYQGGNSKQ